jgi:hypothetical protein
LAHCKNKIENWEAPYQINAKHKRYGASDGADFVMHENYSFYVCGV